MSLKVFQVIIDDSSNKVITGVYQFDHANGGALVLPSGSSLPATGTVGSEVFLNTSNNTLYFRDQANTIWTAISGSGAGAALFTGKTVYVNTTGNDASGFGTISSPWATIQRAWNDRLTYGELRAPYTIQLQGTGSYVFPHMENSVCSDGGYFTLAGDSTTDTIIATGTFTGDMNTSTFAIPTSITLGVSDAYAGLFLHITSGNCSGSRHLIENSTISSVTVAYRLFKTTNGVIANGDTFEIRKPGTILSINAPASGKSAPGMFNWSGSGLANVWDNTFSTFGPRHTLFNVQLSGSQVFAAKDTNICFAGVYAPTITLVNQNSFVSNGFIRNSNIYGIGTDASTDLLSGYGSIWSSIYSLGGTTFFGVVSSTTTVSFGFAAGDYFSIGGGRFDGGISLQSGRLENYDFNQGRIFIGKTLSGLYTSFILMSGGPWVFTVTSGDAIKLAAGALLTTIAATWSGGTSAIGGFGINVTGGGRCILQFQNPVLTGGTTGSDLHTSVGTFANSSITGAGQYLTGSAFGEAIGRTA